MKSIAKLSVRGKLIFAALSGTVFVIAFFFLNYQYLRYQQKLNNRAETLEQLKQQTIMLQKEENAFIAELVNNNDILFLNINNHLTDVENQYNQAVKLNDSLLTFPIFASDTSRMETINDIKQNIDELYHRYQDLILLYQERGTVNHNLIKQWTNTGDELEEIIYQTDELPLITELITLRKNEKNYLISADQKTLEIIRNSIENINALIDYNYASHTGATDEITDNYLTLANQIGTINEQIGIGENKGLRQQLTQAGENLEMQFAELGNYHLQKATQQKKAAFNLLMILYGILIILYFLLMVFLSKSIVNPLYKLNEYLERLTKGELPDKLDWKLKGELGKIINRLNYFIFTLREKKDFAIQLSNGNLDESLDLKSRKDILGKTLISIQNNLSYANDEHKKHVKENRLRQYTNEGINKISEVLQLYSNDLNRLSGEFIMRLVKYLDIEQGALFLMNNEKKEPFLELMGAFAYDRKKFMEKQVLLGQGLVGTCALEKKPIKPKNVPEDYIQITSGLGDSPPNHLFLMPVMNEEVVEGVIELASLKEFEEHQLELIRTIANSLGSALSSIRMNAQTAELLKKSQEQATEMSEQEEEMRQNMEELQATQEEAARREEETKNVIHAYHQTVLVMEYDTEGQVTDINDNYAQIFGLDKQQIIGKNHSQLINTGSDRIQESQLWEDLKKGEKQTRIETYDNTQGETKWLYQQYTPVLNSSQEVYKVINIAYDITEQKNKETAIQSREQEMKAKESAYDTLNTMIEQSIARAEFSAEGQLLDFNQNFEKLIGMEAGELKDKVYNEYLNKVEVEKFDVIWEHMTQSKTSISTIFRRTRPDGSNIWISATFSPVFGKNKDEMAQIIMFGSDITDNIQRITR